jgi:hypothetical protein
MKKKQKQMKKQKRQTYHLFDTTFKRLVYNCPYLLIDLINGSFGTNYPVESPLTFSSTEYIKKNFGTLRSDVMVTIDGTTTYHLEAQTQDDKNMVLRVFEYGFYQSERAKTIKDNVMILRLPPAKVFFLESTRKPIHPAILRLIFPDESEHEYKMETFEPLMYSIAELNRRKLLLLAPFYLLKYRNLLETAKTPAARKKQAKIAEISVEKILKILEDNERGQLLRPEEADEIIHSMEKLYQELYGNYPEFQEVKKMLYYGEKTYGIKLAEKTAKQVTKHAYQEKLESARNFRRAQVPDAIIAESLKLPLEVVAKLKP